MKYKIIILLFLLGVTLGFFPESIYATNDNYSKYQELFPLLKSQKITDSMKGHKALIFLWHGHNSKRWVVVVDKGNKYDFFYKNKQQSESTITYNESIDNKRMNWIFGQFFEYIRLYGYKSEPTNTSVTTGYDQVIILDEEGNVVFNAFNPSFFGPKAKETFALYQNVWYYLFRISMLEHIQKLPPPPTFNLKGPSLIKTKTGALY